MTQPNKPFVMVATTSMVGFRLELWPEDLQVLKAMLDAAKLVPVEPAPTYEPVALEPGSRSIPLPIACSRRVAAVLDQEMPPTCAWQRVRKGFRCQGCSRFVGPGVQRYEQLDAAFAESEKLDEAHDKGLTILRELPNAHKYADPLTVADTLSALVRELSFARAKYLTRHLEVDSDEQRARGRELLATGATAREVERLRRFEAGVTELLGPPVEGTEQMLVRLKQLLKPRVYAPDFDGSTVSACRVVPQHQLPLPTVVGREFEIRQGDSGYTAVSLSRAINNEQHSQPQETYAAAVIEAWRMAFEYERGLLAADRAHAAAAIEDDRKRRGELAKLLGCEPNTGAILARLRQWPGIQADRWDQIAQRWATAMAEGLRRHSDRPGWTHDTPASLMLRVREELDELELALDANRGSMSLRRAAANLANMAMMVADVLDDSLSDEDCGGAA